MSDPQPPPVQPLARGAGGLGVGTVSLHILPSSLAASPATLSRAIAAPGATPASTIGSPSEVAASPAASSSASSPPAHASAIASATSSHTLGARSSSAKSSSSSSSSASSPAVAGTPLSAEAKAKRDRIKAKQAQMAMQATLRQTLSAAIDQNEAQESTMEKQRQQDLEAARALLFKMPGPKRKGGPILIPQAALAGAAAASATTASASATAAPATTASSSGAAAASSSAAAAGPSSGPASPPSVSSHRQSAAARMAAASKMQNRVLSPDAPGTVAVARRRSSIIMPISGAAASAGPSRKPTSPDRSERTVGAGLAVDPTSPSSASTSSVAAGSTRPVTRIATANSNAGLTRSHAASVATTRSKPQSPGGNESLPRAGQPGGTARVSSIPTLVTGGSSSSLPGGDPPISRVNSTPSKTLAKAGAGSTASSAADANSPPSEHRSAATSSGAAGSAEPVPRDRKASTATGGRSGRTGSTAPAPAAAAASPKYKNINAKLKAAQRRQKTMRGPFPPSTTTITVTAPDMNPLATEAAANAAAQAAIAAALTDSDSDDPTSGHTRKRFGALFDNNDDDEDEGGGRGRKNRARERERADQDSDAEPADADAPNASEDSEVNRARARARRRKLVPGPKKRTVSFSSIYNALQLGNNTDDLMGGASTQQQSSAHAGETSVSNMDSSAQDGGGSNTGGAGGAGNSGDGSQSAQQQGLTKLPKLPKKRRDLNNLGPRPRKFEAHGRFQLWIVGLLYWLAIVLQLCSLWSNDWIQDKNSLLGVQDKDLLQWLMVGGSACLGFFGYTCMMLRFHGASFAHNGYKWSAIAALSAQTGLAIAATELWKIEYQHVIDTESDIKQWGSSFNFVILSRTYGLICIGLLLWQEATEFLSRNRAWKLAAALGRLRVMRAEAEMKALARLRAQEAAETPYEDGTMPPPWEEDPAIEAAEAADFQRSTDSFLHELTSLGLSVDASKRLNLAALPSPESVTTLAHTLFLDKDYLSRGQRRLVWTSIVFFCVVFGGGMLYAELEGWNARASIDFALVSLATIGYGNMAPKTTVGRCFMFLYFPMGFAVVGMTVNTLWKVVLIKLDHRFNELSRYISKSLADRREAEEAIRAMKEELEKKIMEERLRQAIMEHQKLNHEGEFEDEGQGEDGEPGEGDEGEEGGGAGGAGAVPEYSRSKSSMGGRFYKENSRGEFEHLDCAPDVTKRGQDDDEGDDLEAGGDSRASEQDVAIDVSDGGPEGASPAAQQHEEQKSPHHEDELPSYHGTLTGPLNPVAAAMLSPEEQQATFPPPPPPQPPSVPAPGSLGDAAAGRQSPLPLPALSPPSPALLASPHSPGSTANATGSPAQLSRQYSISDVVLAADHESEPHKHPLHHYRHANHEKQKAHAHRSHMQHNMAPGPFAAFASVLADKDDDDEDDDDDDDLPKPVAPVPLLSAEPHEHGATEFAAGAPRSLTPTMRTDAADPDGTGERPNSALHADANDPSNANAEPLFEEIQHPNHSAHHGDNPLVPSIQLSSLSSQTRAAISTAKKARRFGTKKVKLFLAVLFCCGWILLSSWLFAVLEEWEYFDAVWFSFITLSTIGYGDFYTSNSDSSAFFLWFVIFGLGSVTYVLTLMSEILMESADLQKEAEAKRKQKQRKKAAKAKADAKARERERRLRHEERDASFVRDVSVIPEEGEYAMQWQENQLLEADPEGGADAVELGGQGDDTQGTGAAPDGAIPGTPKESEPSTPKGTPKALQRTLASSGCVPDMMAAMTLPPSVTSAAATAAAAAASVSPPATNSSSISVPSAPPMRATPRLSISAAGGMGRSLMVPSPATSPGGAVPDAPPMAPPMSSVSPAPAAVSQTYRPPTQFNLALTDTQKQQILVKSRIESISLVPAALFLEFAEEFAAKTKEVMAAAQAAVQHAEEHASLFDSSLLDSYHASYSSLLRAEEKRAKVFESAWMKNMLAMTTLERAEQERAPAPSRAQMLQQINQIKDFKMHLMQRKAQAQAGQGGAAANSGAAGSGAPTQMSAAQHAANAAAFRANVAKRGSITGASGQPGGAASSALLPRSNPPMARIISEDPVDSDSSSESDNEDEDLDWSTVGDRRRISRLIPVAPPIAPPLVKATKVALERMGSRSIGGTPANAAAISAAAEAAVGPGGKALSPMEAAAAVARAMFEARKKEAAAKAAAQAHPTGAGAAGAGSGTGSGPQHAAGPSSRMPNVEYLAPYESSSTPASGSSGSASSEPPKARPAPAPRRASIMLPIASSSGSAASSTAAGSSSSSAATAGIAPALRRQGTHMAASPQPAAAAAAAAAGSHKGGYFAGSAEDHAGTHAAADNKNKEGTH